MKYRRNETITDAWYWDGTRRAYETGPQWLFGWSRWRNGGILVLEGRSSVVLSGHPTWIIREIDGRGVYPCSDDIFVKTYTAVE